jgi:hypothetical protein
MELIQARAINALCQPFSLHYPQQADDVMARKRPKKQSRGTSPRGKRPSRRKVAQASIDATQPAKARAQRPMSRRTWILAGVGVVVAIGGASALHAWDTRSRTTHDLSVIGNGTPVVVQIHDTSCPICRRLKSAMNAALDDRTDIQYRIADISKSDGRDIQQRFDVPNVSLLFFDGEGEHRYTHTGLLSPEEISAILADVLHQMNRPS